MIDTLGLLSLEPPGWGMNLLRGLGNSLMIAVGAFGLGLVIGVPAALGRLKGGSVLRSAVLAYTTVVRSVPELILILLLYFGGTALVGRVAGLIGLPPPEINALAAGIVVLGVAQGAYATEVIRGAIQALHRGQIEAAMAFGMTRRQLALRVALPALLPLALPGLANLWLIATKDTALLAVVGFSELTLETRQAASSTKAYFTFFLAAGALYLMVTLLSQAGFARLERFARRGERSVRT
jgi:polar amino acid transport system permease protein